MTVSSSSDKDLSAALIDDFIAFLNECWTAYHTTAEARRRLLAAGFVELDETQQKHDVQPGGKYFFTRNMSAVAAFAVGGKYAPGDGFVILGAHTDSPCPKLKPVSKVDKSGFLQVGTQPYGGGLWHTWFDRDLGMAGRAIVRRGEGKYSHDLVKIKRPVLRIPTLAIHLTKSDERSAFKPNIQTNFYPILATELKAKLGKRAGSAKNGGKSRNHDQGQNGDKGIAKPERHHSVLMEMLAEELGCHADAIEDFELQLCDTQPSCLGGAFSEFVLSGRLDNLCSSWQSLRALIDSCKCDEENGDGGLSDSRGVQAVFLFDHEEIGSKSCEGAAGTLLPDCMKRISVALAEFPSDVFMESVVRKSFLVSADMAHAVHPNYTDRHDPVLSPSIEGGMVIKHNANQRYATNAVTAFLFRELGARAGVPTQDFAVKNDSGCGSTIGPILSTLSGIRTVDIGSPQLSMHSIREMMGVADALYGYKHLKAVLENFFELDSQLKVDAVQSTA